MKKKYLKITILTLAMTFMSMQAFSFPQTGAANPPAPSSTSRSGTTSTPPPGLPLPIDGFLTYLLIAGSVFGISKLRKKED